MRITPWGQTRGFLQDQRNDWDAGYYSQEWRRVGVAGVAGIDPDGVDPFPFPLWANAGTAYGTARQPLLTLLK